MGIRLRKKDVPSLRAEEEVAGNFARARTRLVDDVSAVKYFKKELDDLWYSDEVLCRDSSALWNAVKNKKWANERRPTYEQTLLYLRNQELWQVMAPLKKPGNTNRISTASPLDVVYLDTMFLDNHSIVVVIDLFSKYCWATASRNPVNASLAKKALQEFLEKTGTTLQQIGEIRCDSGTEFFGAFAEYVGEKKINRTVVGAKSETAPVERMNGTIRRGIEKLKVARGKPLHYLNKYLKLVLLAYNNHNPHSALSKMTPNRVLQDPEAQSRVRNSQHQQEITTTRPGDVVEVGDTVRVCIRDLSNPLLSKKIGPNWSTELFTVKSTQGKTRATLNNGRSYKTYMLQKIDPDLLMGCQRTHAAPEVEHQDVEVSAEDQALAVRASKRQIRAPTRLDL